MPPTLQKYCRIHLFRFALSLCETLQCSLNYKREFQRQLQDTFLAGNLRFSSSILFLYAERVTLNIRICVYIFELGSSLLHRDQMYNFMIH